MEEVQVMKTGLGRLVAGASVAALLAGIAVYSQSSVEAATTVPSSFTVSATVSANCTISAGALAFGAYDPVTANASTDLDQTSTITVACTKGSTGVVSLDNGSNFSGGARRMKAGANFLNYEMYSDSGRTTVWNSSSTQSYTAASKAATGLTVYGRVAAGQDVPVGSYSDTVVASITF
jgi:spore coat protein U domain-containing protein, fimbrial subunit CupE1/2/3/6